MINVNTCQLHWLAVLQQEVHLRGPCKAPSSLPIRVSREGSLLVLKCGTLVKDPTSLSTAASSRSPSGSLSTYLIDGSNQDNCEHAQSKNAQTTANKMLTPVAAWRPRRKRLPRTRRSPRRRRGPCATWPTRCPARRWWSRRGSSGRLTRRRLRSSHRTCRRCGLLICGVVVYDVFDTFFANLKFKLTNSLTVKLPCALCTLYLGGQKYNPSWTHSPSIWGSQTSSQESKDGSAKCWGLSNNWNVIGKWIAPAPLHQHGGRRWIHWKRVIWKTLEWQYCLFAVLRNHDTC